MQARTIAPYGTWTSPLTAARVTAGALGFEHLLLDAGDLYWAERRPSEGGRTVVVRRGDDGRVSDVTPPGFDARTRVHEYGGAAYTVDRGTVYFANFADQRLYRQTGLGTPVPLTRAGYFYADCIVDPARGRLICVREDHTVESGPPGASLTAADPVGAIVAVPLAGGPELVLVSGADFYSNPRVSPDGSRLAWLEWQHPAMPWDETELWVGAMDARGSLAWRTKVAGGSGESIFQPEWAPDGRLYFVSDRTGWWNLYRTDGPQPPASSGTRAGGRSRDGGSVPPAVEAIHPMAAEFGRPQWMFGERTYAFITADRLALTYTESGRWRMALLETAPRKFEPIGLALEPTDGVVATGRDVFFIGGSATEPTAVARMSLAAVEAEIVRSSARDRLDAEWVSVPEAITFQSDGETVHAFAYVPANPSYRAPEGERPPLLVLTHGGPTGATLDVLDERLQFWTSRGFAVLDVNYRGSTGYGRDYRDRLKGQWGLVDVADAVNGARSMIAAGRADPNRVIIRGGSAGGFTTLAALTFHDVFRAGASYYGISDIETLARDTHKFESRYLESLIGPYPAAREHYRQRSPIHFVDRLSAALILFQGLEDRVVPPSQSEKMVEAARRKGLPVAYLAFEGEQHGFRRADTIVRSLEAELYFYGAVFGFTPADPIEPVPIDNLR
jgi:dipeptidyl aminopeptidase/acylaminoacyl peptidase